MNKILFLHSLFICMLILFSGCNPLGDSKSGVLFNNPSTFKDIKAQVTEVAIVNNQLIISGSMLSSIQSATLKNNFQNEVFKVESASENKIIANGANLITIVAGSIFDLILSDAYGSTSFQVSFMVADGSITSAKLNSMGATKGQVLKYNGEVWVPASITNAQTYLGTWNATLNSPDLTNPSTIPGDYYIVSTAGNLNSISYAIGDWIISDGYNWQKVANSAVVVSTFNGRRGIVTLAPGDYVSLKNGSGKVTGSALNDIADVNIVTPVDGSVLKYDSATSKWVVGLDNSGAGSYSGLINKAVVTDSAGSLTTLTTTAAEIGHLVGVTSGVQTQLNAKQSSTLLSGNILVGNGANIATNVVLSGDATLTNTGAITLKNIGSAGTYSSVTIDAQGRVTSGSNPSVVASVSGTGPVVVGGTTISPLISMAAATSIADGYLQSSDWNIFNNKQTALSSGSTINGIIYPANSAQTLIVPLAPVSLTDAVNKQYVDSFGQWIKSSTDIYRASGSVGIGTSNPTATLQVAGPVTLGDIAATTTLSSTFQWNDTTIPVVSTAGYPASGLVYIDNEIILYTSKTSNSLSGLTRPILGTSASTHSSGVVVYPALLNMQMSNTTPKAAVFSDGRFVTNNSMTTPILLANSYLNINNTLNQYSSGLTIGAATQILGSAQNSLIVGTSITANGKYSFGLGNNLTTDGLGEMVIGQYNKKVGTENNSSWVSTDPLFVLANGVSGAKSNALMIFKNGSSLFNGGTTVAIPAGSAVVNIMGTNAASDAASFNAMDSLGSSKFYIRNDGNIGIGTTSPGASSILDISSTTSGVVLPRMTKAQRNAIAAPVAGMIVYQTDNTPGLRVYNGTSWMRFTETAD